MKKVSLFIAFLLVALASKAQVRDYEDGIIYNVFEINSVEARVQLASALATSNVFICDPTEMPGELYIRLNKWNENQNIYAEFDYLRDMLKEEYIEASSLSKDEFRDILNSWAKNISKEYYNFLISDKIGDKANHCMDADPFCTSDEYIFPATGSGFAWSGPNYGCLGTSPTSKQSFWYYMKIGVAGNINMYMEANFDIDFALWGPFNDEITPCPTTAGQTGLLTANCTSCPNNTTDPTFYPSGNLHDCSYSASATETAHIVNGQVGQYFIMLITNYGGGNGNITFRKLSGNGETDCSILPPLVENEGPYCVGETIRLKANTDLQGATFQWSGPGGFTSTQQNPTRPNCTLNMAGQYTCTIRVGNQTSNATTEVIINHRPTANFSYTSVCAGVPMQFTSTSSTTPPGGNMSYRWNFGDGTTGNGASVTHTYTTGGTKTVTLTTTVNGLCTDTKTQQVQVYNQPVANAGNDQTINYGETANLQGTGGTGNFNYHWEPADKVVNPNSQNTTTIALTTNTIFTLTVTNQQGGCEDNDQVTILVNGSGMTSQVTADNTQLCEGASTTLHANALGGTGTYTYAWTPTTGLNNPSIANPTATPSTTTTYSCHVSDGQTTSDSQITITVNPNYNIDFNEVTCQQTGGVYTENGFHIDLSTPGVKTQTLYLHTVHGGCDSIVNMTLTVNPSHQSEFEDIACDTYEWNGEIYNIGGQFQQTFQTAIGCDSIVTANINMEYTPNPSGIGGGSSTHWVIPSSEFYINSYTYTLQDQSYPGPCHWDSVSWNCHTSAGANVNWQIIKQQEDGRTIELYVLAYMPDTVWLSATAYNRCAPQGVTRDYFLLCSSWGMEEHESSLTDFSVIPNPNNGQMTLDFMNMTEKVNVRVYDMRGVLLDDFTYYGSSKLQYDMSNHHAGMYFFVVTGREGTLSKKVIIRK